MAKSTVRVSIAAFAVVFGLLTSCTPQQQLEVLDELTSHPINATGSYAFSTSDGFSGGSEVTFDLSYEDSFLYGRCQDPSWPNYFRICNEEVIGTMDATGGIPGPWAIEIVISSSCDVAVPGCGDGSAPADIGITKLYTPDGTDGILGYLPGEVIDGTDGCAAEGVKFSGSGALQSDRSVSVDMEVVACSPALVDLVDATRA